MQTLKETVFQSTLPARGATRVGVHSGLYCPDFNPRSPHGERRAHAMLCDVLGKFQSTLPARGATRPQITVRASPIFQSTLPARGATTTETTSRAYMRDFNPRSPHGERPGGQARRRNQHPISIHAPRTGSDDRPRRNRRGLRISIHAPRTGSDRIFGDLQAFAMDFNPRSPHGERRSLVMAVISRCLFQSTLPARGATVRRVMSVPASTNFNPRSPHGERRHTDAAKAQEAIFQSTLPARGATSPDADGFHARAISIHAPRTGSDERYFTIQYASLDFNPRSPHGERRALFVQKGGAGHFNPRSPHGERLGGPPAQPHQDGQFQSTLPARGATALRQQPCDRLCISIHAPRTGSDR